MVAALRKPRHLSLAPTGRWIVATGGATPSLGVAEPVEIGFSYFFLTPKRVKESQCPILGPIFLRLLRANGIKFDDLYVFD